MMERLCASLTAQARLVIVEGTKVSEAIAAGSEEYRERVFIIEWP